MRSNTAWIWSSALRTAHSAPALSLADRCAAVVLDQVHVRQHQPVRLEDPVLLVVALRARRSAAGCVASCASARRPAPSRSAAARRRPASAAMRRSWTSTRLAQDVGDADRDARATRRTPGSVAPSGIDPLVEPAVHQRRQRRRPPARRRRPRRRSIIDHAVRGHQGQQAHDALAVGLAAVLDDRDLGLELLASCTNLHRRAGVHAQPVADPAPSRFGALPSLTGDRPCGRRPCRSAPSPGESSACPPLAAAPPARPAAARCGRRCQLDQHGQVHPAHHLGRPRAVQHRHARLKRRRAVHVDQQQHPGAAVDLVAGAADASDDARRSVSDQARPRPPPTPAMARRCRRPPPQTSAAPPWVTTTSPTMGVSAPSPLSPCYFTT